MPLSFQPILRGIMYAVITALVLSGIIGILTTLTSMPESELINNGIFVVSIFFGGITAARISGSRGLYYGVSVALGVVLIILLVSAIMLPSPFSWLGIAEKTFYALVAGGIGGIVGVGLK